MIIRIYSEFSDTGSKYKSRIRSRVSNVGDIKNPGLKQKLLSGDITPKQISVMSTEVSEIYCTVLYCTVLYCTILYYTVLFVIIQEMASDDMKKLRQIYTNESIRDSQMAVSEGTKSDLLKCSKCGKRNCSYNQVHITGAYSLTAPPITTLIRCRQEVPMNQ